MIPASRPRFAARKLSLLAGSVLSRTPSGPVSLLRCHGPLQGRSDAISPYATITDSYTLNGKKDALIVKSGYLKGGTVTYTLTDPKHLTTVNGDGEKTEFKLVRSVNFVQIKASKDSSKPKPGSYAVPPTGRITTFGN